MKKNMNVVVVRSYDVMFVVLFCCIHFVHRLETADVR